MASEAASKVDKPGRAAEIRTERDRGFADSPLEGEGFELHVPPSKRTAVRRARPFVFRRPAAPAAIV